MKYLKIVWFEQIFTLSTIFIQFKSLLNQWSNFQVSENVQKIIFLQKMAQKSGFFWDTNLVIMIFARPCPNLEFSQKMCWFSKLCIFPGFLVLRCSKARKCSEFVPNFVSFGAFYYEKWLTFRKCSEMVPNFTPCGAFNLEKNDFWYLLENVLICIVKKRKCSQLVLNLTMFRIQKVLHWQPWRANLLVNESVIFWFRFFKTQL